MSARSLRSALAAMAAVASLAAGALAPVAAQPAAPAETFGKPVAPFSLAAEPVAPPMVGVPVDVRITLSTRAELEDIEVRISAGADLSVDVGELTLYAPSASPAESVEWLISVVPVTAGAHRLRLFGEALVDGTRQGRSEVATIRAGAGEAAGGESGVQSAEREFAVSPGEAEAGDRAPGTAGAGSDVRRKSDAAGGPDGPRKPEAEAGEKGAETAPERVIRLPSTERP